MPEERNELVQAGGVEAAVASAEYFINKGYLDHLVDYAPIPLQSYDRTYRSVRLCQIEKIVYDKEEDVIDKLVSVYGAMSQFANHVVLFVFGDKSGVRLYLGVRSRRHINVAEGILAKGHGACRGIFALVIVGTGMDDSVCHRVIHFLDIGVVNQVFLRCGDD